MQVVAVKKCGARGMRSKRGQWWRLWCEEDAVEVVGGGDGPGGCGVVTDLEVAHWSEEW